MADSIHPDDNPSLEYMRSIKEAIHPRASYYSALGRFMDEFASIEALMHSLLSHHANVDHKVAQAVFSGVKADVAMGHVRRLLEVYPTDNADELRSLFDQLAIINGIRNLIVHYGAKPDELEELVTSNEYMALTADRVRKATVSPKALRRMTDDLLKIHAHLVMHLTPEAVSGDPLKWCQKMMRQPWRYIPPAPKPKDQQKPKNARKRQRQHESSRG